MDLPSRSGKPLRCRWGFHSSVVPFLGRVVQKKVDTPYVVAVLYGMVTDSTPTKPLLAPYGTFRLSTGGYVWVRRGANYQPQEPTMQDPQPPTESTAPKTPKVRFQ